MKIYANHGLKKPVFLFNFMVKNLKKKVAYIVDF